MTRLVGDQTCSAGKVIRKLKGDPNYRALYDIDSPTRTVVHYSLNVRTRTIGLRAVVIDLTDGLGFPDGMCDVGDGSVIVAISNPADAPYGEARRYRLADGALLECWTTPGSPQVTGAALVHVNETTKLVLTTATENLDAAARARCPNAGSLFIADTELPPPPPTPLLRLPE